MALWRDGRCQVRAEKWCEMNLEYHMKLGSAQKQNDGPCPKAEQVFSRGPTGQIQDSRRPNPLNTRKIQVDPDASLGGGERG